MFVCFVFTTYLQLRTLRHRFKDLPNIKGVWNPALDPTKRPQPANHLFCLLFYSARYSSTTQKFFLVFKGPATVGNKRLEVSSCRSKPRSLHTLDPRHKQKEKTKQQYPVVAKRGVIGKQN